MWGTNASTQQRGLFPESYIAIEVLAKKPSVVPPPIPKRDKADRSSTSSAASKRASTGSSRQSASVSATAQEDEQVEEEEEDDVAPLSSQVSKVGFSDPFPTESSGATPPAIPRKVKAKAKQR